MRSFLVKSFWPGAHGTGLGAHGTGAHGTGAHGTGADHRHAGTDLSIKLAMAVRSIPAYVEHATYTRQRMEGRSASQWTPLPM